jgi:hypothetical protein
MNMWAALQSTRWLDFRAHRNISQPRQGRGSSWQIRFISVSLMSRATHLGSV